MNLIKQIKAAAILLSVITLAACTSVPRDGGISQVEDKFEQISGQRVVLPVLGKVAPMSNAEIKQYLSEPLSLKDAELMSIQVNPMVKAKLAQVGIAEADYAQAGRMENPGFAYERFSTDDNTASVLFDIGGIFLMPLKRKLEARNLEAARYQAAADVMSHIGDTRKAWINAVAEKHQTELMERALESAETSNNLTRQMSALGHSGVIEAAKSELVLSGLKTSLTRQRLAEGAAREHLIRQLGLWGDQARAMQVPDRLPSVPKERLEIESVERQAIEERLDVQMAKFNLEGMAANLRLTRLNPFLSATELGPVREETEGEVERGYEIELRLPIFDAGGVKTQKARIMFQQTQAQAENIAIAAASSAREALATYQASWEIARHMEDQVVPIRQRLSAEELLRYNGMLISVFDLLNDLLDATNMESEAVNASRDYWLADANLQQVLTGTGGSEMIFTGGMNMADESGGGAEH